jgi:hypothetical protein
VKLLDVGGEALAVIEQLAALVALDALLRREVVHPLHVAPVRAHVPETFIAPETLDALASVLG